MYNLQSGQHRRRFPARLSPAEAKKLKLQQLQKEENDLSFDREPVRFTKGQGRHHGAVTGLAVDGLNRVLVSCSDDGKVKASNETQHMRFSLTVSSFGISLQAYCSMKSIGIL